MAVVTGQAGAVTFGNFATTAKLTRWRLNVESENVDTSAAGDNWKARAQIRNDYTVEIEGYFIDQAAEPTSQTIVGTAVAVTLKRKTGDSSAYFADTALVTAAEVESPHNGPITIKATLMAQSGVTPTFVTSLS